MKLNAAQQRAVEFTSGPCLVLAGAGSGKTRVITQKICHLIKKEGYLPRQIAAVTFTNKAAREMRERVKTMLGKQQSRGLMVSTFHTLGLNILKKHAQQLGYKANFSLFDDKDARKLVIDLLHGVEAEDKEQIDFALRMISSWKNALLLPDQVASHQPQADPKLIEIYRRYQSNLSAYNAVDFDDLILLPVVLFQRFPETLSKWQQKIRYLLIDEYQDTNSCQYAMVKLIVGARKRFTVVGDDDQSIYSWRGAEPENLKKLSQDFPDLQLVKLEENYRSSGRILHAANILIENNPHIFQKTLYSQLPMGEEIQVLSCNDEEDEAEKVVAEIISHKFMNQTKFSDYAILYRGNFQARIFEKTLVANRIPYKVNGGIGFFDRAEIKDVMGYLKLVANLDDDNAFLRVVNTPNRGIGRVTLEKLGHFANQTEQHMFSAACDQRLGSVLSERQREALTAFTRLILECEDGIARSEPDQVIKHLFRQIRYDDYLLEHCTSPKAAEIAQKNVSTLLGWLHEMISDTSAEDPVPFSEAVTRFVLRDMLERDDDKDESLEQLQLITLHASKGLEFPHVYLVGMEEGLLPHQTSIDEGQVEEERRLAYVGITRAQKTLTLTFANKRRQYGEVSSTEPSRFIHELPQDDLHWSEKPNAESLEVRQQKGQRHIAALKDLLNDD